MSILEKCEMIGIELRRTPEGKKALEYFTAVKRSPEEFKSEFFTLINSNYIKMHFYAVPTAVRIIESNVGHESVGSLMKRLLAIEHIKEFGEANIPIGKFVDGLAVMSFSNLVKYSLPDNVTATPSLIRLSNALTVECQRINLVQNIVSEFQTNPRFREAIKRFDEIKGSKPIIPYSKEDRAVLKKVKKEYPDVKVSLIYSFISLTTYIKCMIFDSFYESLYEIYETRDVISRNQKALNGCSLVKLILKPTGSTIGPNTGWIMKINNLDNTISYGQIFSKEMRWTQNDMKITVKALIYKNL